MAWHGTASTPVIHRRRHRPSRIAHRQPPSAQPPPPGDRPGHRRRLSGGTAIFAVPRANDAAPAARLVGISSRPSAPPSAPHLQQMQRSVASIGHGLPSTTSAIWADARREPATPQSLIARVTDFARGRHRGWARHQSDTGRFLKSRTFLAFTLCASLSPLQLGGNGRIQPAEGRRKLKHRCRRSPCLRHGDPWMAETLMVIPLPPYYSVLYLVRNIIHRKGRGRGRGGARKAFPSPPSICGLLTLLDVQER